MGSGLKIAITGKGGVGKTTVAAMLAHLAATEGYRVLAVDADPDANLAAALGMPREERERIVPLSERRALIEQRTGANVREYGQLFKLNPEVSDIAARESALADLILYRKDCVVVDMEAGLEHLGRGTAQGVDLMLIVVEPSRRAVETAASIRRMAEEIGVQRLAVFGNKTVGSEDEAFLERAFSGEDYLGALPFDQTVKRSDYDDRPLVDLADEVLMHRFRALWENVQSRATGPAQPLHGSRRGLEADDPRERRT